MPSNGIHDSGGAGPQRFADDIMSSGLSPIWRSKSDYVTPRVKLEESNPEPTIRVKDGGDLFDTSIRTAREEDGLASADNVHNSVITNMAFDECIEAPQRAGEGDCGTAGFVEFGV